MVGDLIAREGERWVKLKSEAKVYYFDPERERTEPNDYTCLLRTVPCFPSLKYVCFLFIFKSKLDLEFLFHLFLYKHFVFNYKLIYIIIYICVSIFKT